MRYKIRIKGITPLLMHNGAAGLDTTSATNIEIKTISSKKGSNRTEADELRLKLLECARGLYVDEKGATIPSWYFRANIEKAARKLKQGPQVREGLQVDSVEFLYDREKLGITAEELASKVQFTVPVVVQRSRILRTRPMFEEWGAEIIVNTDPALVDEAQLTHWLEIGGSRLGLGDWRPEKSGTFGRFQLESIEEVG